MSGDELALDFLAALRGPTGPGATPSSAAATLGPRLATVDAAYSGSGSVPVIFDGESVAGVRLYVALAPVLAGQRVVLLPVGHTYVILGATVGGVAGSDLPAGTSIEGHWTTAPSGFYLEDGSVKTRATDAPLFAVLGTRYNTGGETSLQFRLPDSRGRVPVNQAASGTFATLGAKAGAETVAHTHALSDLAWAQIRLSPDEPVVRQRRITTTSWSSTISVNVGSPSAAAQAAETVGTGLGGATNSSSPSVLQPYIVVTRAIKR